jgi:hypothetical protein
MVAVTFDASKTGSLSTHYQILLVGTTNAPLHSFLNLPVEIRKTRDTHGILHFCSNTPINIKKNHLKSYYLYFCIPEIDRSSYVIKISQYFERDVGVEVTREAPIKTGEEQRMKEVLTSETPAKCKIIKAKTKQSDDNSQGAKKP